MYRTEATTPPLIEIALANAEAGQVIFALHIREQSRQTAEHAHERGQIIAATTGVLAIATERQHLVVPPGHAIWLPPRHRHAQRVAGVFSGWTAYVAYERCTQLPAQPRVLAVSGLLREAVLRVATWRLDGGADAAQERIFGLILDEIATLPQPGLALAMPTDRRLLNIATALSNVPGDQRSLQEWASWAGIAPRTLTRRFSIETGLSFSDWRQRVRLMHALELLAAGQAVTTVALELGYDSLSAFIAMFKRHFGMPPSQFSDKSHR